MSSSQHLALQCKHQEQQFVSSSWSSQMGGLPESLVTMVVDDIARTLTHKHCGNAAKSASNERLCGVDRRSSGLVTFTGRCFAALKPVCSEAHVESVGIHTMEVQEEADRRELPTLFELPVAQKAVHGLQNHYVHMTIVVIFTCTCITI